MTHAPVVDVLKGKYAVGESVTVKGWVRTRRDSKAGLSFIALHDGSCFDPVQVLSSEWPLSSERPLFLIDSKGND